MAKLAQDIDLQVAGFRIAPRDLNNPLVAAIGEDKAFFPMSPTQDVKPKVLKERPGMGGGFKIPEELIHSKNAKNEYLYTDNSHEDHLVDESNILTRDEIIKELNLASGNQPGTEGKNGSLTKTAIANELVDNITKELEKLRRQSENIQTRQTLHTKGEIGGETEEERNFKIHRGLEDMGCTVIHAENERVQAERHQTGQLGGLGSITLEEVLEMKNLTAQKLKDLEMGYYQSKDTRFLSEEMRKKLQGYNSEELDKERQLRMREKEKEYYELEAKANEIRDRKKFLASPYNPDRTWVRRIPEMKSKEDLEIDESQLLAKAKKVEDKPLTADELKRLVYEAKFSKYRTNRKLKEAYDESKDTKENFDLYLKGKESTNQKAKAINWDDLFAQKLKPQKYSKDYPVYEHDYDIKMLETMRQKLETLSKEDKLTFSILKWIFNALKKKDHTINRKELIEQLDQNIDVLQSLGFEDIEDVSHGLGMVRTKVTGKLNWEEFLDFFGSRTDSFRKTGETWWKTEQEGKEYFIPMNQPSRAKIDPETRKKQLSNQAYNRMTKGPDGKPLFSEIEEGGKTEDNLKKLAETRVNKLIIQDIENEIGALKRSKSGKRGETMKTAATLGALGTTNPAFKTSGQCILQSSHMEIMKEVFRETDRFNDQIVRRTDLITNLKESRTVQKFLDQDAVKVDRKTKLSVDDILKEIQRDQYITGDNSDEDSKFDHKEFITWDEFVEFFENYQTPEQRLKAKEDSKRTRQKVKTEREQREEFKQQIEEEKDKRVEALPRFREADIIDTEEEYLDIVFSVFDNCSKPKDNPRVIEALEFFMALKKDPEVIKINDTIAREPDGKSRVATETFSEVFYRMEKEHTERYIDWPTILEYFTKRGRPLTLEEIEALKEEDRNAEDEYEQEQENKKEEEAQFYKSLREEQKDFNSTGGSEFFGIEGGREDISDMEAVGTGRPDLTSTVGSKKNVTFKDTDKGSTLKSRPQTAKSKFDSTLSRESLTGRDYAESSRSKKKKNKSTERKITVPKPFRFDTRENIRSKSIRERKLDEMIEEKRIEEENILGFKFRAKQPAKEIITPLFQQIMHKNEQRRLEVKENSKKIMAEKERPFDFYLRDKDKKKDTTEYINEEFLRPAFKANEVPTVCTVELYKIMVEKENKEREIRIKKNAEKNFKKSRLPPRMELHEKMKQDKGEVKVTEDLSRFGTFQPSRAKPIPDFDRLQRNFQETLDRKKTSKQLTEPKPFNFEAESANRKKGHKTKASLRTYMDMENDSKGFNTGMSKAKPVGHIPNYGKPSINPKTTKKQSAMEQSRRKELEKKMKNEMQSIKENKKRYEQQNRMKKTVQTMYAALDNTKEKEAHKKDQLKSNIEGMVQQEKKNKEMIKGMIERGRGKELLIERFQQDLSKKDNELQGLKAVQMAKEIILKNGLDPDKHLSEAQKDKLADAEFLEKHKLSKLPKK